jgi:hypothetical protein
VLQSLGETIEITDGAIANLDLLHAMHQCRLACVDLDRETAAGLLTGAR